MSTAKTGNREDVGKKLRRVALKFLLQIWLSIVVLVIVVSELLWLPASLESTLSERINQFQYVLQLSSRLAAAQKTDLDRETLLRQLNLQAQSQGWQEIVYSLEVQLRQQAKQKHDMQLLLQRMPGSDKAYGLWFNSDKIILEQATTYRLFELIIIILVTGILFIIWLRRSAFVDTLEQFTLAARSLAKGDFSNPFPKVHRQSVLLELINTFEVTRKSLAIMRRELLAQIEAKKLGEQRLQESHNVANLGCWEWKPSTDQVWFSDSLRAILCLEKNTTCSGIEDLVRQVHSADKKQLMSRLKSKLRVNEVLSIDFRISNDGMIKHVHLMASVRQQKDSSLRLIGTCQDISDRKDIEASLQKLSSAITSSGSGVMITDVIGTVEYINPKFTETTGFELSELEGSASVMLSRDCLPEENYEVMWRDILAGKSWRGDLENIRKDGSSYWSIVSISPINNEYGELTHFVIVSEDVSKLKDAHAKMEKLALYDELTGLPNRRLFFRELTRLFEEDVMKSPAVVMLLDLDNFKTINDTQGHPAGDKLLIEVAARLLQDLPEDGMAARLGGDEFAVLINPVKNAKQVDRLAQRVLETIAKPYIINDNEIHISTSIGLAWLPKDGNMPDTILKHADLAMYQAKEMGRNQYRQFTEQLHDQLQRYIRFSREMPEALANGDFTLCFQPKMDLLAQKVIGVEALIRWQHPELGSIS
ncbi:MAG: diguanylate cyclase, partial [Pseudomonadales bacterium]|nr:diguanylate cyclase [Pseudomonadales bacterium]